MYIVQRRATMESVCTYVHIHRSSTRTGTYLVVAYESMRERDASENSLTIGFTGVSTCAHEQAKAARKRPCHCVREMQETVILTTVQSFVQSYSSNPVD